MNETKKMLQSLGLYISAAKRKGKTLEECLAAEDYCVFLGDFEEYAAGFADIFGFGEAEPLMPLDEIALGFSQYCAVAKQVYEMPLGNISLNALYLPYPQPPAMIAAAALPPTNYFDNYLKSLHNDTHTENDVNEIMDRINEILMRDDQRVRGLVVGRVQSGKTRNYVGLILKAIDEGWNIIIVLTSCSTALADQTEERIFKNIREVAKCKDNDCKKLNFRTNQPIDRPSSLKEKFAYVGVAMKQTDNLDRINKWFEENRSVLGDMRVLLIDDEADNATPDSNAGTDKSLSDEDIDGLVDEIREASQQEGANDFQKLADWVDRLHSDGEFSKDEDADNPDAKRVEKLQEDLKNATGTLFDEWFPIRGNDNDLIRFLSRKSNQGEECASEISKLIKDYFKNKSGHRGKPLFLYFLQGMLKVAVTRSAINHRICTLVGKSRRTGSYNFGFGRFAYIAYTATPYANMFNERPDQTPLYPDFIYSLHQAPQYFGLDKIFGEDMTNSDPKMKIASFIPTCREGEAPRDEVRFILRPIQGIKDTPEEKPKEKKRGEKHEEKPRPPSVVLPCSKPDKDLVVTCDNPPWQGEWKSLKEAIAWFFCTAAARRWHRLSVFIPKIQADANLMEEDKVKKIDELDRRWTTMLVNISQIRDIHVYSEECIDEFLKNVCSEENRDAFIEYCRLCWKKMTASFTKEKFDDLFNAGTPTDNYGRIDDYPTWGDIVAHIGYFINGLNETVHLVVINSENVESREKQDWYYQRRDAKSRWDYSTDEKKLKGDHAWIVCGGNTISRGLTLPGLTASYFDRVRSGAAVDTLTQMGRWFGFRPDYELLPRLWMTEETVKEMKRICVIENQMHETMRENFEAHYDPSDPDHYQQVYYWGRRLSGRQRQFENKTIQLGTTRTTDNLPADSHAISDIYESAKKFVDKIGETIGSPRPRNKDDYPYWHMPLWENVPLPKLLDFLNAVKDKYPDQSKRIIESLIREIVNTFDSSNDPSGWDVVIGDPDTKQGEPYFVSNYIEGGSVKSGAPKPDRTKDGIQLRYRKARSDMAFYAMIHKRHITQADHEFLKEKRDDVLKELKGEAERNGGILPSAFRKAFDKMGAHGDDIDSLLNAYIEHCDDNPDFEIAACIRNCFTEGQGLRNRSTEEYFAKVHTIANHSRPILQLYFITPPEYLSKDNPIVTISFYWPKHNPYNFQVGTVLAPPPPPHPFRIEIWEKIGDILRNNNFPMTSQQLKEALMLAYPEEKEWDLWQKAQDGGEFGNYKKLLGQPVYYSEFWAKGGNPKKRLYHEVANCAGGWIRRQNGKCVGAREVVEAVMRENPRFEGIVDISKDLNTQIFTDEEMARVGVMRIRGKGRGGPIMYQAQ